jgi:hypothetical protein
MIEPMSSSLDLLLKVVEQDARILVLTPSPDAKSQGSGTFSARQILRASMLGTSG